MTVIATNRYVFRAASVSVGQFIIVLTGNEYIEFFEDIIGHRCLPLFHQALRFVQHPGQPHGSRFASRSHFKGEPRRLLWRLEKMGNSVVTGIIG